MSIFSGINGLGLYEGAVLLSHSHGWIAGSAYSEAVPSDFSGSLRGEEALVSDALSDPAKATFLAGRIAFRAAAIAIGGDMMKVGVLGVAPSGAPVPPLGFVASLTNKDWIALALVAPDCGQTVGIDLESFRPRLDRLSARVLRHDELQAVDAVGPAERWRATLVRFSIKEAAYKALNVLPGWSDVSFLEMSVRLPTSPLKGGFRDADLTLFRPKAPEPRRIEATYAFSDERVVTTVSIWI